MRTGFENVLFGEVTGGVDLDVCLIEKGLSYAEGECICDDRDDDTLVIEVFQLRYILRFAGIGRQGNT